MDVQEVARGSTSSVISTRVDFKGEDALAVNLVLDRRARRSYEAVGAMAIRRGGDDVNWRALHFEYARGRVNVASYRISAATLSNSFSQWARFDPQTSMGFVCM